MAFYWAEKSAEQDYAPAQMALGGMYYFSKGVEKNLELAFYWAEKSAEQGYALAQVTVSQMYYDGEGVERNLKLSSYWYEKYTLNKDRSTNIPIIRWKK